MSNRASAEMHNSEPMKTMKPAIAYTRVSTKHQGDSGVGVDFQMAQINQLAAQHGFQIEQIFSEARSAAGARSIKRRPILIAAVDLARKNHWPIFIADYRRLSRNLAAFNDYFHDDVPDIYVASIGGLASLAALRAGIAHAEHEKEVLLERTTQGMVRARNRGKVPGNSVNLPEARAKAVAVNAQKSRQRDSELDAKIKEAELSGARTAQHISDEFNKLGFKTARGGEWTAENFYSRRRGQKLRDRKASLEAIVAMYDSIYDAEGSVTLKGLERVRAAMLAKDAKPEIIDKTIVILKLDTITGKQLHRVLKFMVRAEASIEQAANAGLGSL